MYCIVIFCTGVTLHSISLVLGFSPCWFSSDICIKLQNSVSLFTVLTEKKILINISGNINLNIDGTENYLKLDCQFSDYTTTSFEGLTDFLFYFLLEI